MSSLSAASLPGSYLSGSLTIEDTLSNQTPPSTNLGACCDWAGRVVQTIGNGSVAFLDGISEVFGRTVSAIGCIGEDPSFVSGICKKFDVQILNLIAHLKGDINVYARLQQGLGVVRDTMDVLGFASCIHFFASGEFKKCSKAYILGMVSLFATNTAGTLAWLSDVGAVNLGSAAQKIGGAKILSWIPSFTSKIPYVCNMPAVQAAAKAIGNVRVFSVITQISLGWVATRALGVAYVFFAIDAARRLIQPGNIYQKTSAGIDLSHKMVEIALCTLTIVNVTNVIALGVLGTVGLGLAVTNFVYNLYHKNEINSKVKPEEKKPEAVAVEEPKCTATASSQELIEMRA